MINNLKLYDPQQKVELEKTDIYWDKTAHHFSWQVVVEEGKDKILEGLAIDENSDGTIDSIDFYSWGINDYWGNRLFDTESTIKKDTNSQAAALFTSLNKLVEGKNINLAQAQVKRLEFCKLNNPRAWGGGEIKHYNKIGQLPYSPGVPFDGSVTAEVRQGSLFADPGYYREGAPFENNIIHELSLTLREETLTNPIGPYHALRGPFLGPERNSVGEYILTVHNGNDLDKETTEQPDPTVIGLFQMFQGFEYPDCEN